MCLVDELAHDNPPQARLATRWEEVEALRDAGITVISAVNIQFLEELQPRVQDLLGPRSRPTVPLRVVREADEIVLVDADEQEVLQAPRSQAGCSLASLTPQALSELRGDGPAPGG